MRFLPGPLSAEPQVLRSARRSSTFEVSARSTGARYARSPERRLEVMRFSLLLAAGKRGGVARLSSYLSVQSEVRSARWVAAGSRASDAMNLPKCWNSGGSGISEKKNGGSEEPPFFGPQRIRLKPYP